MTSKEEYRELCQQESSIPLFSRDWWLDIVCGTDDWDVLLYKKNGRIEAAMPLYLPWHGVVSMPVYTQTMGPWIAPESEDTKYTHRLSRRQEILQSFVGQLKGYTHFFQNFSYPITDWLPFYWDGYKQTTRYTYILDNIKLLTDNPDSVWENMSQSIRRNIRKAQKQGIEIRSAIPIPDFLEVQRQTFQRQGLRPVKTHILEKLIRESLRRNQGRLWGAYDSYGNLHAAIFVVIQDSSAYYLAGGGNPRFRSSGAHSLTLWQAVQDAAIYTDRFDFEGSMLPGVERFFREFGAKQMPYFAINKGNLSLYLRACMKIKFIFKSLF